MNIKEIKEVVNAGHLSKLEQRLRILAVIALDKQALPDILSLLERERKNTQELIMDLNSLMGMAEAAIDNPVLNADGTVSSEITVLYEKYKGIIGPTLRRKNELYIADFPESCGIPPKQTENLGTCMEGNCKRPATIDYNGHGHMVCAEHDRSLNNYFDEEYK